VQVVDDLRPRNLGFASGREAAVPLLAPTAACVSADIDDDIPARRFLSSTGLADSLMDMPPHQLASSQASRAGTGTTSRRPSLRVGNWPRRAAS
jgi:hypothetical protein